MQAGIDQCTLPDEEEHGGIILKRPDESEYLFNYLRNDNAGLPIARVLFSANKEDVGKKVVSKLVNGWKSDSSFHVHPCGPMCSSIDITRLFLGFSCNYIYGRVTKTIIQYKRLKLTDLNDTLDEEQIIWYPLNGDIVIWKLSYVQLRASA